ncbi:MAG: single-stranded DNA-binding protein [Chitinispirillaceae bacterium]
MTGVNKVILIGNLGKDPELKYTPQGRAVTNFPLATSERWTDKNGQKQERTEWHNIVLWGRQAEVANQYLQKGRTCYIEGRISTRSWEDRDGNKRYRTEIEASTMQFIGGGSGQGAGADRGGSQSSSREYFDSPPDPQFNQQQVSEPDVGSDDLPF